MEQNLPLLKKYFVFSKERFPLFGIMLYSGSLFYASFFFASAFPGSLPPSFLFSLPGFLVVFLVLLHLRILDEHKDYEKDRIAYPDRMLSRGHISLRDLRILMYAALIIECACSIFYGLFAFIAWLLIIGWSLLMFKEFFISDFLNENIGLYLVTHQMLVPIVLLFGLNTRYIVKPNDIDLLVLFFMGSMFATITYEIARKTWSSDREQEHADSYTKAWGIPKTVAINQVSAVCSTGMFLSLFSLLPISLIFTISLIVLYLQFLIIEIFFLVRQEASLSKYTEWSSFLFLIGFHCTAAIAFAL